MSRHLPGLALSVLLHGGAVIAGLLLLTRDGPLAPLLVDLIRPERERAEGAAPIPVRRSPPPASRRGAPARPVLVEEAAAPSPKVEPVVSAPAVDAPAVLAAAVPSPAAPVPVAPDAGVAVGANPPMLSSPAGGPSAPSSAFSVDAEGAATLSGASEADAAHSALGSSSSWATGQGRGGDTESAADPPGGLGGARAGQELAMALPGAASADPLAEYAAYLAALRERIQAALRYPASARRRGLSGTVHIELTIGADGVIDTVALLHSSAHSALDEAALQAVRTLAQHRFPSHLPARPLRVRLPVVFALQ